MGPAAPGTVGALTDKQGFPEAAYGAVTLVPIHIVKEDGLQEYVLSRGQRLLCNLLQRCQRSPTASLLTLHGAHIPPSNKGCCVYTWRLPQQRQMSRENGEGKSGRRCNKMRETREDPRTRVRVIDQKTSQMKGRHLQTPDDFL